MLDPYADLEIKINATNLVRNKPKVSNDEFDYYELKEKIIECKWIRYWKGDHDNKKAMRWFLGNWKDNKEFEKYAPLVDMGDHLVCLVYGII